MDTPDTSDSPETSGTAERPGLADNILNGVAQLCEQAEAAGEPLEVEPHRGYLFEYFVTAEGAGYLDEESDCDLSADALCRLLGERCGRGHARVHRAAGKDGSRRAGEDAAAVVADADVDGVDLRLEPLGRIPLRTHRRGRFHRFSEVAVARRPTARRLPGDVRIAASRGPGPRRPECF